MREIGFHDILREIKVSHPIDVRRMSLLELLIKKRNEGTMLSQNQKGKKNVRSAPCHNANVNGRKECQELCIGSKKILKQEHKQNVYSRWPF